MLFGEWVGIIVSVLLSIDVVLNIRKIHHIKELRRAEKFTQNLLEPPKPKEPDPVPGTNSYANIFQTAINNSLLNLKTQHKKTSKLHINPIHGALLAGGIGLITGLIMRKK